MAVVTAAEETGIRPALRSFALAGGAAGVHTVTGIEAGDSLLFVWHFTIVALEGLTDVADLVGEFLPVTVDGQIDNTGGTATTADKLLVVWAKRTSQ